jgi:hypothetical protein
MPRHNTHDYHGHGYEMQKCLDCPAMIPKYGLKVRCAPCASAHYDKLKSARAKARRKAKNAP